MNLPRDLSGTELAKALGRLGYRTTCQSGGHMRLTTMDGGQHHVTVPNHESLKLGTLAGILSDVAAHFQITRDELLKRLFGSFAATP
ncbi:MAG TPA: type II toxin-antitoxin system HicA family toxin [Alphaproteobacteria bacterium]